MGKVTPRSTFIHSSSGFVSWRFCLPGVTGQCLQTFLGGHSWVGVGMGPEARDAAKYPTMERTGPHDKISGPKCPQCQGEQPCIEPASYSSICSSLYPSITPCVPGKVGNRTLVSHVASALRYNPVETQVSREPVPRVGQRR